jgi:hypothetical protein
MAAACRTRAVQQNSAAAIDSIAELEVEPPFG